HEAIDPVLALSFATFRCIPLGTRPGSGWAGNSLKNVQFGLAPGPSHCNLREVYDLYAVKRLAPATLRPATVCMEFRRSLVQIQSPLSSQSTDERKHLAGLRPPKALVCRTNGASLRRISPTDLARSFSLAVCSPSSNHWVDPDVTNEGGSSWSAFSASAVFSS